MGTMGRVVIPNVAFQAREQVEAMECEKHAKKGCEEAA